LRSLFLSLFSRLSVVFFFTTQLRMGSSLSTPERILAAARAGDAEGVRQAIEFGRGQLRGLHNGSGSSTLASDSGASLRSSRLLEAVDEKGWTALVHAAHLGKVEIVEMVSRKESE